MNTEHSPHRDAPHTDGRAGTTGGVLVPADSRQAQKPTSFWRTLADRKRPFFCLAPMADVTDPAFRRIVAKYGKPDVLWTEFVSADGLCHPKGREKLLLDLAYTGAERPIVAQLFSSRPENMRAAARLCTELGFDGIDINMGCPDRTIEKQGCGSAMIRTPDVAAEVIRAARQGIADAVSAARDLGRDLSAIPLSVKTRVGYAREDIDGWIGFLLRQDLDALTVHARTRKDLSQVPAKWEYLSRIVRLRDALAPDTVVIGNGDVSDLSDGQDKARATGCDGVMIGRAIFGNPWIFNRDVSVARRGSWRRGFLLRLLPANLAKRLLGDSRYTVADIPLREKLRVMVEHTRLFEELLGGTKNFAVMRKHYKAYAAGFSGAKELRIRLMETHGGDEVEAVVAEFLSGMLH